MYVFSKSPEQPRVEVKKFLSKNFARQCATTEEALPYED
jgi:hypothetical protein